MASWGSFVHDGDDNEYDNDHDHEGGLGYCQTPDFPITSSPAIDYKKSGRLYIRVVVGLFVCSVGCHFGDSQAIKKRWNAGTAFQGQKDFARPTGKIFAVCSIIQNVAIYT